MVAPRYIDLSLQPSIPRRGFVFKVSLALVVLFNAVFDS